MTRAAEPPLRSAADGIDWPAVPGPEASDLLAQLYQLERTQWLSRAELEKRQNRQLSRVLLHAARHSPFYAERLAEAGLDGERVSSDDLRRLPLLTRAELCTQAARIDARFVPKSHGRIAELQTSGSTGQIVAVKRTGVSQLMWLALTMRDHLWHRRDVRRTLAAIRANVNVVDDDELARRVGWGPPVSLLYPSGPGYALPLSTDVATQVSWLVRRDPGYLLTYPTNLAALLDHFEKTGERPRALREVRTIGETLSPELRSRCRDVLGVRVVDNYSSQELGTIAIECPESGLYHVQSESLIVEVLDEAGAPCAAGQSGRVVVTDLHNFATPLIRYELRDYAEVGPDCPCGRGLPTLARVLGRRRNMVVLPRGERYWPLVGLHRYREVAPILQYQLVQHSLEEVEMRLVTAAGRLDPALEQRLSAIVQQALGHPFRIRFSYFERELEKSAGGKFEEFVCLVDAARSSRRQPD